ncbi:MULTISPECIES: hypothetical protein [unclassified Brevundimonas]|jgi:hypothetical protein|uniref:hypothetical protein n=1 Tax=unclassified Brevundimonas TaxID=2622653 RepID=UPI000C56AA45|nr:MULTISPECIES: hypothetical protein [unclassified Brevundimonas]MAL87526.1 hypothetical protein [Brevundimonas sp.]HAV49723.1 hypothetical protein [Brevundimonas sp.]|tara:strand:- start:15354 stop:15995 length:642 start_codon:yes stop_codon:yes gene_type:complete
MCPLIWSSFSWEAFATIFAGVLAFIAGGGAIIGAIIIGKRQAAILKEQTAIQARQALIAERALDIEELKVRTELFKDRFEVYQATREWLNFIVMYARLPGTAGQDIDPVEGEREMHAAFFQQLDRARFLFRPSVYDRLNGIVDQGWAMRLSQRKASRAKDDEARVKFIDAEHDALNSLSQAHSELSAIFGEELNLSSHGSVHGDLPTPPADAN